MKVLLTFDVEVWCNTWEKLDDVFPGAFKRYIYGGSRAGQYALPETLKILERHGLHAVFFVEPLFAARFGISYLRTIVSLIQDASQDVQLHLHPEWTDEITPPPLPGIRSKRQHLRYYSLEEQTKLIRFGAQLLRDAGASVPTAFRAGSFAADANTFVALARNKISYDSSIDATFPGSVPDLRGQFDLYSARDISGVRAIPLSVFTDGSGRLRHAQVGACSGAELVESMRAAAQGGWPQFVILSHSFELLKAGSSAPDRIVVGRFNRLCEHLGHHVEDLPTTGFNDLNGPFTPGARELPKVRLLPTLQRYAGQALRRLI